MNKTISDVVLGFFDDVGDQMVVTSQCDNLARNVKIKLIDDFESYLIQDTSYIYLKQRYPNGIAVPPTLISKSNWNAGENVLTLTLTDVMLAVPGMNKCEIALVKSTGDPFFGENGALLGTTNQILTTQKFNLFVRNEWYNKENITLDSENASKILYYLIIKIQNLKDRLAIAITKCEDYIAQVDYISRNLVNGHILIDNENTQFPARRYLRFIGAKVVDNELDNSTEIRDWVPGGYNGGGSQGEEEEPDTPVSTLYGILRADVDGNYAYVHPRVIDNSSSSNRYQFTDNYEEVNGVYQLKLVEYSGGDSSGNILVNSVHHWIIKSGNESKTISNTGTSQYVFKPTSNVTDATHWGIIVRKTYSDKDPICIGINGWGSDERAVFDLDIECYSDENTLIDTAYLRFIASQEVSTVTEVPIPTYTGNLKYNGYEQTASFNNYNSSLMTVSGNKGLNAGTYTAVFSLKDKSNTWSDGTTNDKSVTWTIDKATLSDITVNSYAGYKYGASSIPTPTISSNPGNGTVTFYGLSTTSATGVKWSNVNGTTFESGTRYIYATITGMANYYDYTTPNRSYVIGSVNSVLIPTYSGNLTYNKNEQTATFNNYDSSLMTVSGNKGTNAGAYTATFTLKDKTNNKWSDGTTTNKTVTWKINKASFTATVSISSYAYGGTKSTPTISNNPGNGTVTYYGRATSTGTSKNWTSVTSTTYDVGTRYIYAEIAETTNYNKCTTGNTPFSITKGTLTGITVNSYPGYTYGASSIPTPTISSNPGGGTVTFYGRSTSSGTSTVWSSMSGTKFNAGTRYVYATITGMSNYNDYTTANREYTIDKATLSGITVNISGYTYGGTKSTPTISSNPGNGTITYYGRSTSSGASTNWSSVTNKTYDAGTRYCYATITNMTNYKDFTTPNKTFTISKGSFTATVSINGYKYGSTKSTPSVSNNPGNGTVTYYGRATSSGTSTNWNSVTATTYDPGTRYCYAVIAESTNYLGYTTGNTTFTVSKADGAVTIKKGSSVVSSLSITEATDITVTSNSGGTLTVSSNKTSVVTVANTSGSTYRLTPIASGTATITASVAATTYYTAASSTLSITVIDESQIPVTGTMVTKTPVKVVTTTSLNGTSYSTPTKNPEFRKTNGKYNTLYYFAVDSNNALTTPAYWIFYVSNATSGVIFRTSDYKYIQKTISSPQNAPTYTYDKVTLCNEKGFKLQMIPIKRQVTSSTYVVGFKLVVEETSSTHSGAYVTINNDGLNLLQCVINTNFVYGSANSSHLEYSASRNDVTSDTVGFAIIPKVYWN